MGTENPWVVIEEISPLMQIRAQLGDGLKLKVFSKIQDEAGYTYFQPDITAGISLSQAGVEKLIERLLGESHE